MTSLNAIRRCSARNDVLMIDHGDFSVVVKSGASAPKLRQWEIYRAGRNTAIDRSKAYFATAAQADKAGKVALRLLLSEYP